MAQVTYLQYYAYHMMKYGFNVFLTGDAGTGKSFIVKKFIDDMQKEGVNIAVMAPTGIAADNINGVTMHSQFKLPLEPLVGNKSNVDIVELSKFDIILIEEISMCRIDLFDTVVKTIFDANSYRKRYGKKNIQLILVGDFYQLPPVITDSDRVVLERYYKRDIGMGFAFESEFWDLFNFKYIILTEVIRQANSDFIHKLNRIRLGDKTCLDEIYDKSSKHTMENAVTLYGVNVDVNKKNKEELNKLNSKLVEIEALAYGDISAYNGLAELILELKIGARVMTIRNDAEGGYRYVNGSLGTLMGIYEEYLDIKFDNGNRVMVRREDWEIYKYTLDRHDNLEREIVGIVKQFPVKLAYSVTIHKSQGQTYDAVNLNPYCWDCGQLYVALSRVRDLSKMYIACNIDKRYLVVSGTVRDFYNKISKIANQNVTQEEIDLLNKKEETFENIEDADKIFDIFSKL